VQRGIERAMLLIAYVKLCKAENKLVFGPKPRYNNYMAANKEIK
jgi:hypothetical protein